MVQNNKLQEDEIDLRELFKTIWDKKVFIFIFTLIVTIGSIVYVFFKNPTPIYEGSLLVEIAQINSNRGLVPLDYPLDLKYIIETETEAEIVIPSGATKIIQIIIKDVEKDKIELKIKNMYEILVKKQELKLKIYSDYIPTKMIGNINIDNNPVNKPKKKLTVAVAFVTGFILSIFLVFFIEFIKGIRKEEKIK